MKKAKRLSLLLLPFSALLLSGCQGTPFTSEDFTSKLFPNGFWDFLIQLLAFVVLLIAVFVIGYKPVKKMLKKRHDGVNAMIEDAKTMQRDAHEAIMKKEETIAEGKEQAASIIEAAKRQAESEAAAILAKAEEEASAKRKKADEDIEAAKKKSEQEIHDQIIDVALAASSKVLGREVNEKDNKALLDDFLQEMK